MTLLLFEAWAFFKIGELTVKLIVLKVNDILASRQSTLGYFY